MADDKRLQFQVHTPEGTVVDSEVESLILPGEDGQFGVLYNHIPYMALLDVGTITIREKSGSRKLACGGGFAEIEDNTVTVLAETAEFPDSIDRSEVEETIEDLNQRLTDDDADFDDVEREELLKDLERNKARLAVLDSDAS
jgi:F-type H+-transporting ATPase subunit epsilon